MLLLRSFAEEFINITFSLIIIILHFTNPHVYKTAFTTLSRNIAKKLHATVYTTSVDLSFLIGQHNSCATHGSLAQPPLSRRLRREIKLFPNRPSYPPICVTHNSACNLGACNSTPNFAETHLIPLFVHCVGRRDVSLILRRIQPSRYRKWEGECAKGHSPRNTKICIKERGIDIERSFCFFDFNYMIKYYFIDITAVMLVIIIIFTVVYIEKNILYICIYKMSRKFWSIALLCRVD